MREIFGVIVFAVLGYFLYQELYGTPSPMPLPEINNPYKKADQPKVRPGDNYPSAYTDPGYIHKGTEDFYRAPESRFKPSVRPTTATPADAPVQCGDYYLYYPPSYWRTSYPTPRVISVSLMPPDLNVEEIELVWSISGHVPYNKIGGYQQIPRKDARPVMMAEAAGLYVAGHLCGPYKPLTLTCARKSPWC